MRNFNYLLLGFSILAALTFFHFRGIFYPDEGYILNTASRILSGEILYKDFDFVYTPVTPFINSVAFLVINESIFSSRLFALFISLLTVFAIFEITKIYTKSLPVIILSILLYFSWGPTHINFIWPSIISLSIGIFSVYFLLAGLEKKYDKYIALSGLFSFLVFLTKQNLGIAVLLSMIVFLLVKTNIGTLSKFILGILIGITVFIIYLVVNNSYLDFARNFYDNLILKILIEGTISTPILYDISLYSYIKLAFYISPLLISIYSLLVSYKNKSSLFALPLFSILFYLAGFRPVTDYVHLSPLIASLSLSLIPLFTSKVKSQRSVAYVYSTIFILVGFYTSLFFGYYKWEAPLAEKHIFLNNPKVNIWVSEKYHNEISLLSDYISDNTNENDYIFINYYSPMLYFLLDQKNPTGFDYVSNQGITENAKRLLIRDLEAKDVKLILIHKLNTEKSLISDYIYENYQKEKQISEFTIWKQKNTSPLL